MSEPVLIFLPTYRKACFYGPFIKFIVVRAGVNNGKIHGKSTFNAFLCIPKMTTLLRVDKYINITRNCDCVGS